MVEEPERFNRELAALSLRYAGQRPPTALSSQLRRLPAATSMLG